MLLLGLKKDPQSIRPAVAGDGAACFGHMDLFEFHRLLHCLPHKIDIFLRDPGVGDKEQVCIDV